MTPPCARYLPGAAADRFKGKRCESIAQLPNIPSHSGFRYVENRNGNTLARACANVPHARSCNVQKSEPQNLPLPGAARVSLLRPDVFERIERLIDAAGQAGALLNEVVHAGRVALPRVDACLLAADEVCRGRIEATERLWLLLRSGERSRRSRTPAALLNQIAGGTQERPPRFIRGDRLVNLIFGTVRAARTPEEADAMLDAVCNLIDPLLLLEYAAHALEEAARGQLSPLRALEVSHHMRTAGPAEDQPVLGGSGHVWVRPVLYDWKIADLTRSWPSVADLWGCAGEAPKWASSINKLAAPYVIESISNRSACAGELIRIHGHNFGPSGRVQFQGPDAGDPDAAADTGSVGGVEAVLWTDSLIEVVVPVWARSGELRLLAYHTILEPCLRLDVYHLGNSIRFRGGRPYIHALEVNGRDFKAWVPPLAPATVSWHTSTDFSVPQSIFEPWDIVVGGGTVRLDITNKYQPEVAPWHDSNLPAGLSSLIWLPPPVSAPTEFTLKLTASGHCGESIRELSVLVIDRPTLKVEGIEVTQGIQVFSLSGARNTLPTVAGKDTIVRVYVSANRALWPNAKLPNVTAALNVNNILFAPINGTSAGSSTGGNPFLELGHASFIDRRNANASFNFRIPAALSNGTRTLSVSVWGTDEIGVLKASDSIPWTWHSKSALRFRYVRVNFKGTMPTDDEARRTAIRAVELLPFPATDIAPAWLSQWNTSVTNLSTSKGKQTLLDHLHDQHNCTASEWLFPWEDDCPEGDGAYWLGVVSDNIGGKAKTGDNTAVVASVDFDGQGDSAAHELGHNLCLAHVNQGCDGTIPDESNLCGSPGKGYASLPLNGAITEVPFDVSRNATVTETAPKVVCDLMSYACTRWISPTHWQRLFDHP
jgi:hypothetical protein